MCSKSICTMRVLLLVLLIALGSCRASGVAADDTGVRGPIKNVIDDFIEKARNKIPEEIDVPDKKYQGPNVLLLFSTLLEVTDTKITGVKNFDYDIGYKGVIPSTYMFNFNAHTALEYLFRLALRCLPAVGINSGSPVTLDVNNLKFSGDLKYTVVPPRILINTMTLQIDGVQVKIESIFGSSHLGDLISENISSQITSSITTNSQDIANQLKDLINSYLEKIFPGGADTQNGTIIDYTEDEIEANAEAVQKGLEKFLSKIEEVVNKLQQ